MTDGDRNYTYAYDGDGNRISKTVDGVTTDYYYIDGKLLGLKKGQDTLLFLYDETGTAYGFLRNGTPFYYAFNLQGDVIAIYNETGMEMVTYSYDVWGNHTCIIDNYYMGLANLNPLRYRGYYYDSETGLYYLQSRYYDPEVGRFISADNPELVTATLMGHSDKNLFAYCDNNPISRADNGGGVWHIVIGAVVGGIINGASTAIFNLATGKSIGDGLATSILSGIASGALACTGIGAIGMIAGNASIAMAENAVNQVVAKGFTNFDVEDMLIDGTIGGISGAIGGPGKGSKHLTNLGKQSIKRSVNAFKNKGLKAGIKETGKALLYYGKNTKQYYKEFVRGIPGDVVNTVGTVVGTSSFAKRLYRRIFGR